MVAAPFTTYLTIPLYPTTNRTPLPQPVLSASSPLDLPLLYQTHTDHALHATRVASLFRRLDVADVWALGATCEVFDNLISDGHLDGGIPSVLQVKFEGWTEGRVGRVLGEAGKGWCELREVPHQPSALAPPLPLAHEHQGPELVLPTLDFSSSFLVHSGFEQEGWTNGGMSAISSASGFWDRSEISPPWEQEQNQDHDDTLFDWTSYHTPPSSLPWESGSESDFGSDSVGEYRL